MENGNRLKLRYFLNPFFAVILILTLITIFYFKNVSATKSLAHAQDVKIAIQSVLNKLQDAEIGERGYIITQEAAYLEPYNQAEENFRDAMALVTSMVQDNPYQLARLDSIQRLSELKFDELERTIKLIETGDVRGAINVIRNDSGKIYMDQLRVFAGELNAEENRLLVERRKGLKLWRNLIIGIIFISILVIGLSLYRLFKNIKPIFDELTSTKSQLKNVNANLSESLYNTKKANHKKLQEIDAKEKISIQNELLISKLNTRNDNLQILIEELNEVHKAYKSKPSDIDSTYVSNIDEIILRMKISMEDIK